MKFLKTLFYTLLIFIFVIGCSNELNKSIEKENIDTSNNLANNNDNNKKTLGNRGTNKRYTTRYEYYLNGSNFQLKTTRNYYYNSNGNISGLYEYVQGESGIHQYKTFSYINYGQAIFIGSAYNNYMGSITYDNYDYSRYPFTVKKVTTGASSSYMEYDAYISQVRQYYSNGTLTVYRNYFYDSSNKLYEIDYYDAYSGICYGYYYYTYNSNNVISKISWFARSSNGGYNQTGYSTISYLDSYNYVIQYWYDSSNKCYAYYLYYLDSSKSLDYDPIDPTCRYNL